MLKQSSNKGPFWGPCSAELRQRDMSALLCLRPSACGGRKDGGLLYVRSLAPARYARPPALTACDLDWENDSWQCDGRQCRRRIAFVLLAMIVVQIVAFDFENRLFHSTIFAMALSGIAAASGDRGLHSASSRFARAAYSGLCARAPQRRASRIMCRAASG